MFIILKSSLYKSQFAKVENTYQCVFLCHQDETIAVNQVAVNVLFEQTSCIKRQEMELV